MDPSRCDESQFEQLLDRGHRHDLLDPGGGGGDAYASIEGIRRHNPDVDEDKGHRAFLAAEPYPDAQVGSQGGMPQTNIAHP